MNCIQTYVQTQSLGTIIEPVNGSWIQAYAEYIGLVAPVNDSWLQAICEEFGIMAPLYGSWTIALANYYNITSPNGTWWCAIAQAPYVPPGGTPPFIWNLDTRLWEAETREWAAAGTNLLDVYPGASLAFSLRNLTEDYTGALIRVKYTNNTQEDIGFDGNGELDTATLLTNTAANGGDAFVVTWYDQSGNGNNASSANTSSGDIGFRIVTGNVLNTENGKPAANNVGRNGMTLNNIIYTTGSLFIAGNQLSVGALNYIGGSTASAASGIGNWFTQNAYNSQAFLGIYQNASNPSTYATPANQFIANWDYDSTWNVSLNNGAYSNTTGNFPVKVQYVWGRNAVSIEFNGNCQEYILWPTTQQTNLNGISTNMNDYYSVY